MKLHVIEINEEIIDMVERQCSSTSCSNRRIHHEQPDIPRGIQKFWVAAHIPGPWFCSIECSVYGATELAEPKLLESSKEIEND